MPVSAWFPTVITQLLAGSDLESEAARQALGDLLDGRCDEIEAVALLVALRAKGESPAELAETALALRARMIPIATDGIDVLDTCGTGGDGTGTFNISTATAFVVAAAGVPVVKHGNRAVSSRSGSSEVLETLGIRLQSDPAKAKACLAHSGLAFCHAPAFHPVLHHLATLRRRLGVRTILNCVGPLANPARAAYQLLGVGSRNLLDPMARALAILGVRHAFLVCGSDGLDEVTLGGTTLVREIRDHAVTELEWRCDDFGLEPCHIAEIKAGGAEESAQRIREILDGSEGPARRVVVANSAAALLAAEHVPSLTVGVARADEALRSGRARQVLDRHIEVSQTLS